MASSSGDTWGTTLWQSMVHKGPSTASVRISKALKPILRKLQSFCKPISGALVENLMGVPDDSLSMRAPEGADTRAPLEGFIVLAENPRVLGIPPGRGKVTEINDLVDDCSVLCCAVLEADRCRSSRAIGAHDAGLLLLRKINTIFKCQQRQVRLDVRFEDVQEAFEPQKILECFPGSSEALKQLGVIEKDHSVATAEGTALAASAEWDTVLLVPAGPTGWAGALEVARKLKFVKPDFPELSDKITAIEIKREVVERRRGLQKVPEVQGRLSLVPALTFQELGISDIEPGMDYGQVVASEWAGSSSQHLKVYPFPEPGYDRRYEGVKTSWIRFPDQQRLFSPRIPREMLSGWNARTWLVRAELVQLRGSSKEDVASIEDFLTKYRWYVQCLGTFCLLRWKHQGKMLNVHRSFDELLQFPLSFCQTIALSLEDQLPGQGWQAEARDALGALFILKEDSTEKDLYQTIPQVDGEDDDDEEDHDDQFGAPPEPQPPLNPDYLEVLHPEVSVSARVEQRVEQMPSLLESQPREVERHAHHAGHAGQEDQPRVVERYDHGKRQGEQPGAPPVQRPARHEQP